VSPGDQLLTAHWLSSRFRWKRTCQAFDSLFAARRPLAWARRRKRRHASCVILRPYRWACGNSRLWRWLRATAWQC